MPTLSYELTLPQNTYPALDRLFSVFRNLTNSFLDSLSKLIAYLRVVYTSTLKVDDLLRWENGTAEVKHGVRSKRT